MDFDARVGRLLKCSRCAGDTFIEAGVRRDPVSFELIQQVLCVSQDCQMVLGVMSLNSLAEETPKTSLVFSPDKLLQHQKIIQNSTKPTNGTLTSPSGHPIVRA